MSRSIIHPTGVNIRATCEYFLSDYTMRKIVLPPKRVPGYRWGAALILMGILQLGSLPTLAQYPTNVDYYAPRTTGAEKEHLSVVTSYHLAPGQRDLANGRYHSAVGHAEFILNHFTNHPQALSLLSEACLKWKDPKCDATAEGRFQKAIARNPDAAPTYVVYAIHLHRKEHLKEAVEAYRRALELAPESVNAHYNLGLAYIDLKQYDLANQHAQKSYQLGAFLPGLRTRLEKLGKWNPAASMPTSDAKSGSEAKPASDAKPASEAKPADQPSPETEKTPN